MPTDAPSWDSTQDAPSWSDTEAPSEAKADEPDWKKIEADYNRIYRPPLEAEPPIGTQIKEALLGQGEEVQASPFGLPAKALALVPRPSAQEIQNAFDVITNPTDLAAQSNPPSESAKATAGAIGVGRGVAEGLASPIGVATLGTGALPSAAQRLVGLGFAADMASQVPEQAARAGAASVNGDTQEQVEAFGNLAVTPIMASAIGAHSFRPRIAETIAKVESELPGTLEKTKAAVAEAANKPIEVEAKVEPVKEEVKNAEPISETAGLPESEVRALVGEEAPLRQQGEAAGVQEPAQVSPAQESLIPDVQREQEIASEIAALRKELPPETALDDPRIQELMAERQNLKNRYQGRKPSDVLKERPSQNEITKDTAPERLVVQEGFTNETGDVSDPYVTIQSKGNAQSGPPEAWRKAGHDIPDVSKLPSGTYTIEEARNLAAQKSQPTPPAESPAAEPPKEAPPTAAEPVNVESPKVGSSTQPFSKSDSINSLREPIAGAVEAKISSHPQFVELKGLVDRSLRSIYGKDAAAKIAERTPEDYIQHTEYDAGSAKSKQIDRLQKQILRESEIATSKSKTYRGNNIDWYAERVKAAEPQPALENSMGGALGSAPVDPRAQIDQLADAFKGVKGEKIPLGEAVKRAFDLGGQIKNAKGVVDASLNALKTSGDFIKRAWEGVDKIDDVLRVKGELSSELNKNSWRIRQFAKQIEKSLPDVKVREAIAKWVDAGGDEAVLRDSLAKVPANKKAAYERALNLTAEEKVAAQNIQNYFEGRLKEAQDAGIVSEGIEDYIHRIYEKDTEFKRGALAQVQAGILNTRTPGLALKRLFKMDAEAEAAGYNVVSDFLPRIADYESSLAKVIASRAAVKRFSEIKMADGRPMVDVAGVGIPVPEATAPEATLIKPSAKSGGEAEANRLDYVNRNYPALKKWKWVTTGENGQPVLVQGDVLIHPDAIKRIDTLLKPSAIRQSSLGRTALGVSSTFKNTMLDFSGFHQVQLAVHGAEHKVAPGFELKDIDLTDPKVEGLLKGGVTLGGDPHGMNYSEGLIGRSLSRQIPGLGKLAQTYHEWLFQDYIPRLKMTMALHALERNRGRFEKDLASGKMSEEALNHLTAKEANAAFGELNYTMLERSRTAQDLSRLILLAPDFLEARGRFAAQALTKRGGEQRMALWLGAVTMFVTARIMNKILDDQYHLEPENLFNVVYKGKSYGLRTVQQDILHAATDPFRFMLHRLNPTTTRPLTEALTGRDEFGRKRDFWQIVGDSISNIVPISLRSSREQHIWESMLNSFGITERRFNEVDSTYKLAEKWKQAHKIQEPGEFIYDRDKDPLRALKIALSENDEAGAAQEIAKLIKDGTTSRAKLIDHFNHYASSPFTGSFANDRKFAATLSEDERKTYEASKEHKRNINKLFRQALQKQ